MQDNTRISFNRYKAEVAQANRLPVVTNEAFNITPENQQSLHTALGEQTDFLKNINQIPVTAQLGDKIGLGVSKPIASRVDTEEEERETRYLGELDDDKYVCTQTNFDTHLKYSLMDSWAHLGNFGAIYAGQISKQIARDTIMVGWRGESVAKKTDLAANPLLEDVNEGWITKVRKKQPSQRFMGYASDGAATNDAYKIGEGGHYNTLDALVFDMLMNLLDPWHQDAADLVVMVGREVWVHHGLTLLNNSALPTERNALQTWFASKTVAGLPCIMPPYLPKRSVIVTSYDNLSVYHQVCSLRRTILDNPKRDRVEEYISENVAYAVEDYGKFAGVRDGAILMKNEAGQWV